MLNDGYAAVGTRRVASQAGVAPSVVYYYFPTLDDLFLAVLRRRGDEQLERQAELLASDQPLRTLWEFSTNPAAVSFITEFMALANHRKVIGGELAEYGRRYLECQHAALKAAEADGRINFGDVPPEAVLVFVLHVAHGLMVDRAIGMSWGNDEAFGLVERLLGIAEGDSTRSRPNEARPTKARPSRR
jgi:AcrR family transcriptional regulator